MPTNPPTPLAQMSPEELADEYHAIAENCERSLFALIQRATREAFDKAWREGMVPQDSVSARNLEFIIEQRDDARAQLAEAQEIATKYEDRYFAALTATRGSDAAIAYQNDKLSEAPRDPN